MAEPRPVADRRDETLCELVNIAFGHSAQLLSQLLGGYVRLKVPTVERLPRGQLAERVGRIFGEQHSIHMVRQTFRRGFHGESLTILEAGASHPLGTAVGLDVAGAGHDEHQSVVLETANLLTGGCISKLAELLGTTTHFSPPVLVAYSSPVAAVPMPLEDDVVEALLIRIDLDVETDPPTFGCLMLLMPPTISRWLDAALDQLIADLS